MSKEQKVPMKLLLNEQGGEGQLFMAERARCQSVSVEALEEVEQIFSDQKRVASLLRGQTTTAFDSSGLDSVIHA